VDEQIGGAPAYAEGAMRSSKLFSSIFFYIDPGIIRPIHHPIE